MKTSETINELCTALIKAQGEFSVAAKSAKNSFFKSHYADLQSIIVASRPALVKNGLGFSQMCSDCEFGTFLVTRIFHTSGQWMQSEVKIRTTKDDPQSFGSALSYFKRYSLQAALGIIASDDDDDGNSASGKDGAVDYSVASKDVVLKLIKSFEALYVSKAQLENYVQQSSDAFTMDAVEALRQIWSEIKTGKAKKADYFGT